MVVGVVELVVVGVVVVVPDITVAVPVPAAVRPLILVTDNVTVSEPRAA